MSAAGSTTDTEAWKRRLPWLVTFGFFAAAAIIGAQRYALWRNRPPTNEELSDREILKENETILVRIRASAKTPDELLYVDFLDRVKTKELEAKELRRFNATDGVDRFEAWLLALAYFPRMFGSCGFVLLPQLEVERWRVRAAVGRNGNAADVLIDPKTGAITCEGKEAVVDPMALIRDQVSMVADSGK